LTRDRFKGRPLIEVVYEDLVSAPVESFQRIGAFLGVDDIDPKKINLRKQNADRLEDLIINFDDVQKLLSGSRFAEYLTS